MYPHVVLCQPQAHAAGSQGSNLNTNAGRDVSLPALVQLMPSHQAERIEDSGGAGANLIRARTWYYVETATQPPVSTDDTIRWQLVKGDPSQDVILSVNGTPNPGAANFCIWRTTCYQVV